MAQNVSAEDKVEHLVVCRNVLDTSQPDFDELRIAQFIDELPRGLDIVRDRIYRNDLTAQALVQRDAVPGITSTDIENRRSSTEPKRLDDVEQRI